MDGKLMGTSITAKREPGSNGKKGVLHMLQSSKRGAIPLVAVLCSIQFYVAQEWR